MDVQRLEAIEAKTQRGIIPAMRIVAGLLWLANLHWKRPTDFGQIQKNGLFKYVQAGIDMPVFPPFSWVLEHIIVKQYHLFGWISLLTETVLAAGLLVGWKVRWLAVLGVVQSAFIGLSVIHLKGEWPWSYYLMIALHLMLFATAAGKVAGLDGLTPSTRHRAWMAGGAVAIGIGLMGVIGAAGDGDATARVGSLIGWKSLELKFMTMNLLAALITVGLGMLLVVAAQRRRAELALVAGAGFAVLALQVLIQWRNPGGVETGGVLGSNGGTMAFWLALALAALVPALAARRQQPAVATS